LREAGVFLVAARLVQRGPILLLVHVGDALEEEQREDISLEVGGIHRVTLDVGGLPEVEFALIDGSLKNTDKKTNGN